MDAQLRIAHTQMPSRRHRGAEERIKQLIARHRADREALAMQAEYMQRVAAMLIPLVPKHKVSRILAAAKESSQTNQGESYGPQQNKLRHWPEQGTGTAG